MEWGGRKFVAGGWMVVGEGGFGMLIGGRNLFGIR